MPDFPSSPALNTTITDSVTGAVWQWDGARWTYGPTSGGGVSGDYLPLAGGVTMTGRFYLAGDAQSGTQPVTLQQMTNAIAGIDTGTPGAGFLPLTGGTLTGSLTLAGPGAANSNQAVTVNQLNAAIAGLSPGGGGGITSLTAGTGLTGGTITTSGTIALTVPVTIANGGTGATTAAAARAALLPAGSNGQVLTYSSGAWTAATPSGAGGAYLPLAGGTLTGNLNGTNIAASGQMTGGYIVSAGDVQANNCLTASNCLSVAGGAWVGEMNVSNGNGWAKYEVWQPGGASGHYFQIRWDGTFIVIYVDGQGQQLANTGWCINSFVDWGTRNSDVNNLNAQIEARGQAWANWAISQIGGGYVQNIQINGMAGDVTGTQWGIRYNTLKWTGDNNWYISPAYVSTYSGAYLKENIRDSNTDALALMQSIPVRAFDWKENHKHTEVGLIAEEVMSHIPEMVWKDNEGGLFLQQQLAVPYLIRAIQQLIDRIEQLERRTIH
jgi:hypothetical protein